MTGLGFDLRFVLRSLLRRPGYLALGVGALAVGVGATAAVLAIVDAVLLRGLPLPEPGRVVVVWENDRLRGTEREFASLPDYRDLVDRTTTFEAVAGTRRVTRVATDVPEPERLRVRLATPSFFDVLGLDPIHGRTLQAGDDGQDAERVSVLAWGYWMRRFGGDPSVIGSSLELDGETFRVIGVMPSAAELPGDPTDAWLPLIPEPDGGVRGVHNIMVVARVGSGSTIQAAQAEASAVMSQLEVEHPEDNTGRGAFIAPLQEEIVRDSRRPLLLLVGAVVLVLGIAVSNVAGLVMVRSSARTAELAVREALGARSGRITRLVAGEAAALAGAGWAAGLGVAALMLQLVRTGPAAAVVPGLDRVTVDLGVASVMLGVSLAGGLLAGRLGVAGRSRAALMGALQSAGRSGAVTRNEASTRRVLVTAEVAVAFVLLFGTCVLLRSFNHLLSLDPGFDTRQRVALTVELPESRYPNPGGWPITQWPEVEAFAADLSAGLAALPGVQAVSYALNGPHEAGWTTRVTVVGRPEPPPGEQDEAVFRPVGPGWFETAGIPLRRGREFGPTDGGDAALVAVVNEAFVARYFPASEAIGQSLRIFGRPTRIVGVVGDVRFTGLAGGVHPAMYVPFAQAVMSHVTVVVRVAGGVSAAIPELRRTILAVDPDLAIFNVTTLDGAVAGSVDRERFLLQVIVLFAAVAVGLAGIGVYGVVAQSEIARRREMAVRLALGASARRLVVLVAGEGMRMATMAMVPGLLIALVAARALGSELHGVAASDPLSLAASMVIVLGIANLACVLPAWRAARTDPARILRQL